MKNENKNGTVIGALLSVIQLSDGVEGDTHENW